MRIINIDGSDDRIIVANARAYGEDRAIVWIDDDNLVYIGPDELTYRLNLTTGKSELLVNKAPSIGQWTQGWLLDPTLRYATTGQPSFSRYQADGLAVRAESLQGGCQPYFTADGRWGFWTGGGGGPLNRIDLESRKVEPIITKNDPTLPRERSYLYFPMISRDRRLFTFGASPDQHDHFNSDYDIFIVPLDPESLTMIGRPVRYTFDKGCDRFSDVFLYPLPLGQKAGKAPLTVKFSHPDLDAAKASVDFGDGRTVARQRGPISHTYDQPGTYTVVATVGETTLRGMVRVMPAEPPKLEGALLVEPDVVRLIFDEPINPAKARLKLASGIAVKSTTLSEDGRSMILQLGQPVAETDSLRIEGIADLAQRPNIMPATSVELRQLVWPVNQKGLVLLWAGSANNAIFADDGHRACNLTLSGKSYIDSAGGLAMRGGLIIADEAAPALLKACRQSNEFTLQTLFRPAGITATGPARIVSFSTDSGQRNFTLGQDRDRLVLRLRTPATGDNGTSPEVTIGKLQPGEPAHVIITYKPGQLTAYLNGQKVSTPGISGDFRN